MLCFALYFLKPLKISRKNINYFYQLLFFIHISFGFFIIIFSFIGSVFVTLFEEEEKNQESFLCILIFKTLKKKVVKMLSINISLLHFLEPF